MSSTRGRQIDASDGAVACAIAFGMGVVVAMLGPEWLRLSWDFGSIADWVAAVGTWVIGFGAWKYAREAHYQRVEESQRALALERYRQGARIRVLKRWADTLRRMKSYLSDMKAEKGAEMKMGSAVGVLIGARILMESINFEDEAWQQLGEDAINLKISIRVQYKLFLTRADEFIAKYEDSKDLFANVDQGMWRYVDASIEALDTLGDKLLNALDSIPRL